MNWKKRRLKYWVDLFGKRQLNQDLDEEIRAHIAIETRRRIDNGESPDDARMNALREIRSVALVTEATREAWNWSFLERFAQDLRYAGRMMLRTPVFALVVVLSLAIGIGANTTLFSLVDAMLLRKLPVERPDELVFFKWTSGPKMVMGGITGNTNRDDITGVLNSTSFSLLAFNEFRRETRTLSSVFAFAPIGDVTVNVDGHPDIAPAQVVSGNYFSALGVTALIGRTIADPDEQKAGQKDDQQPVAVIGHGYWQRRFAADRGVVGKSVVVNGVPLTIIGVTQPGFAGALGFGEPIDISIPLKLEAQFRSSDTDRASPRYWWLRVMGRLRPGMQIAQAHAELERLLHAAAAESVKAELLRSPAQPAGSRDFPFLGIQPGSRGINDNVRSAARYLRPFSVISAILLMIVCINVANLLLARATGREREIAVRLALGAGRARVIRQLLTETLLLFAIGGAIGSILAYWGKDLVTALFGGPGEVYDLRVDLRVLMFTAGVSLISAVIFGIAPAFRATSQKIDTTMKEHARTLSGGGTRTGLRKSLLTAQVALSLVLLFGAGLFVRTVWNLQAVSFGFDTSNLLLFQINPRALKYDDPSTERLYAQMQESIARMPGVIDATLSNYPMVSGAGDTKRISVQGMELPAGAQTVRALTVRANFFSTLGARILSGRSFTANDRAGTPRVGLINETFARTVFGSKDPIGAHFGFNQNIDIEIVGVVADLRVSRPRERIPMTVYVPDLQAIPPAVTFTVRTAGDPLSLVPSIREALRSIDPNLPLNRVGTQTGQVQQSMTTERTFAAAATFFGMTALVLACIGLFGLTSYSVEKRMSEIGLRIALGARPSHVVRLIMRQTLLLVVLGTVIGVAGAFAARRVVANLLFEVAPNDPITLGIAIATMLAIAGLAAYFPARRATRVNPTVALRA